MKKLLIGISLLILLTACAGKSINANPATTPTITPEPTLVPPLSGVPAECGLAPIVVPKLPAKIPGYMQVDPATGLHVTGKPLEVDFSQWRLAITGKVAHPQSFTFDQLRCMPKVTDSPQLVCERQFVDDAAWSGVSLKYLLDLAGLDPDASIIKLISADGYVLKIDLKAAIDGNGFLAYELNGQTMPVLHGFPLRAVFPTLTGFNWVKWIVGIEIQ